MKDEIEEEFEKNWSLRILTFKLKKNRLVRNPSNNKVTFERIRTWTQIEFRYHGERRKGLSQPTHSLSVCRRTTDTAIFNSNVISLRPIQRLWLHGVDKVQIIQPYNRSSSKSGVSQLLKILFVGQDVRLEKLRVPNQEAIQDPRISHSTQRELSDEPSHSLGHSLGIMRILFRIAEGWP